MLLLLSSQVSINNNNKKKKKKEEKKKDAEYVIDPSKHNANTHKKERFFFVVCVCV